REPTISDDGRLFANARADHTVLVRDVVAGTTRAVLRGHQGRVTSVRFLAGARRMITTGADHTIRFWDAGSGEGLRSLTGPLAVAFSPDGTRIATGSLDQTVRLTELRTGRLIAELKGHRGWVNSVDFSPDGRRLVSGSQDHTLRLWDGETGAPVAILNGHTG